MCGSVGMRDRGFAWLGSVAGACVVGACMAGETATTADGTHPTGMHSCITVLFTKPPDGLPSYRTESGGRSVRWFPIDIFPFCREGPVTKEPAAL